MDNTTTTHKSGFVNIIGQPNVGKSTLMNALVGERMSIITNKPQTTRHRILGIMSGENFQVVFSDTPGFIRKTQYKMQERMNSFVRGAFEDADLMLWVIDAGLPLAAINEDGEDDPLVLQLAKVECPVFLVLNKIDLLSQPQLEQVQSYWKQRLPQIQKIYPIAALHHQGTEELLQGILALLPEGPAYYPKDQLTDRPERFFVSEIIREKLLLLYHQEVPYACEVVVESFKEDPNPEKNLVRISAMIYVERPTQKPIIIGEKGRAIKELGIQSRQEIERFLEKKVHLELFVKIREGWRDDDKNLERFGYR